MEALVDSIMSAKPDTVDLDMTVVKAAGILAKREERCLIVAKNDLVLGIVTPSDMVDKVIAAGANPAEVYVRDIMSTPVITVSVKATVGKAAELMSEYGVGTLPVVDDSGALAGLITSVELARYLAKMDGFRDPALNALAKLKIGDEGGPYR